MRYFASFVFAGCILIMFSSGRAFAQRAPLGKTVDVLAMESTLRPKPSPKKFATFEESSKAMPDNVKTWFERRPSIASQRNVLERGVLGSMPIVTLRKIVSNSQAIVRHGRDEYMVNGFDFEKCEGGNYARLPLVRVVGVDGFLYSVEAVGFDVDHHDKLLAVERQFRTWKSTNGEFEVEARLVDFRRGVATIVKRDGVELMVASSRLSSVDREFIRDEMKRRREVGTEN